MLMPSHMLSVSFIGLHRYYKCTRTTKSWSPEIPFVELYGHLLAVIVTCKLHPSGILHVLWIMASKYTPETNAMPHQVVKIVGSKQVKYFVEGGPNKEKVLNEREAEDVHTSMGSILEDVSVHTGQITPSESPFLNEALTEYTRIHKELQQKGELKDEEPEERVAQEPEERVAQAVREELQGWGVSPLKNIERDVLELDASFTGTIHQSLLTYVFLRNEVPLKLPTLGHLFHTFSEKTCPDEVQYRELLHFLRDVAEDDQKEMKTDESSQPGSRPSVSAHSDLSSPPTNDRTNESWVERFQKMERALDLCDIQNTGLLDKDKARRLIQNYNVILDLNLSPLKIAEATRSIHSEGRIHLASALRCLKGL
ncbi:uncharacterized protein C1orf87 isoform X2 [Clupea harengus]|uniref:Uncharacterized protein C1orf87 isoform X2 n=1 Tax=Clupea harengus TaxID=7950 RepID=A0A6P8G514_CLUHA|nr:uncharacterized protein C1orf87 isoform X2 [Clupea harengus]